MAYLPEQKDSALELLKEPSNSYATVRDMTGIPVGTLSTWAKKAGITRPNDKTEPATDARRKRIASRRAKLSEKLLRYAENMADKANAAASSSNARDAKDLITAAAIAIDKFRLEMGEATQVVEERSAPAEKVAAKLDQLAERRRNKEAV